MRLFRFSYSCYALKAQMALDLCGVDYDAVEVPYCDRDELATLTGGYIMVPVLDRGSGGVLMGSDTIVRALATDHPDAMLPDATMAGPVWAYHDWCDQILEDVLFRCATPALERRFERASDRALFRFIKERRYGAGCIDDWTRNHDALLAALTRVLEPTLTSLAAQPFVFGDTPSLADAALYGPCRMLEIADAALPDAVSPTVSAWMRRLEHKVRLGKIRQRRR